MIRKHLFSHASVSTLPPSEHQQVTLHLEGNSQGSQRHARPTGGETNRVWGVDWSRAFIICTNPAVLKSRSRAFTVLSDRKHDCTVLDLNTRIIHPLFSLFHFSVDVNMHSTYLGLASSLQLVTGSSVLKDDKVTLATFAHNDVRLQVCSRADKTSDDSQFQYVSIQTVGNPNRSSPYCQGNTSGFTFSGLALTRGVRRVQVSSYRKLEWHPSV